MNTEKDSDTIYVKKVKHGCKKTKGMVTALAFVGSWVKEKRLKKNFSQSTLGKKVGVGKRTIMDIESNIA
ncbi:MAG: helix-turn-helix domain-containing protein, partial [Lachnospiraceae bacterium]|nr:helix-turn-helix domain-containing protein [Lachnospiraceae bacterium]